MRYTVPDSKIARSGPLRATLCRAASSSEPSSVGRMIDCPSDSGFSSSITRRSGCSAPSLQPVEQRRIGEAPADDLVQAAADHRVLGGAAHALGVREHAGGAAARRQRRRQALEAVDARDLLDQVDLARDVVAAQRRHPHLEAAAARFGFEVERVEDLGLARGRDGDPEDRLHARLAQPDFRARGDPAGPLEADVDRAGNDARAAQLDHQLRRERLRVHALLRLQPLLEAPRGLAAQAERPRAAVDVGAVPGRDLHQHARRVRRDLRARAAHQPGDRGGPLVVLDHDHLVIERARLAVERLHLLAVVRAAHGQARAGDAVEVEGVQRLAAEQHRVVGDVDDVVDRALPGGGESRLQPRRRRRDRDVLEHARGEARAQLGALDGSPRRRTRGRACRGPRSTAPARAARRSRRAARARRRRRRGSRAGWA